MGHRQPFVKLPAFFVQLHQPMRIAFIEDIRRHVTPLFQQRDLTPESFADTLRELLDRSRLQDMAVKARVLSRPDATGLVVNAILRGNA